MTATSEDVKRLFASSASDLWLTPTQLPAPNFHPSTAPAWPGDVAGVQPGAPGGGPFAMFNHGAAGPYSAGPGQSRIPRAVPVTGNRSGGPPPSWDAQRREDTIPVAEAVGFAGSDWRGHRSVHSDSLTPPGHSSGSQHPLDPSSHSRVHSWGGALESPKVHSQFERQTWDDKPTAPTSSPSTSYPGSPSAGDTSPYNRARDSAHKNGRPPVAVGMGSSLQEKGEDALRQELATVRGALCKSETLVEQLKQEKTALCKQIDELQERVDRLEAGDRPSSPEYTEKRPVYTQKVAATPKYQCCLRSSSEAAPFGEEPTLLVEITEDTPRKFRVHECGRELLQTLPRGKPVKVLSIVGEMRRGKSYIMNRIMGVPPGRGFEIGHLNTACTKGLWALAHEAADHTLLAVDAEGLYDPQNPNEDLDHAIFRCVLLLSSFVIYNTGSPINSAAVGKLKFIAQLIDCMGVPGCKDKNDPRQLQRVLPPLLFLTRDRMLGWNPAVPDAQAEVDQNVLRLREGTGDETAGTKNLIRDMFPRVLGFSLPMPVDGDPKKIAGSPDLIKPEFLEESERLRKEVMETLQCKTILSEDASGQRELTLDPESFLAYTEHIVASSKEVPAMGDLFEAVSSNLQTKVVQDWRDGYCQAMNEVQKTHFPLEEPDFVATSLAASENAISAAFAHHNLSAGLKGTVTFRCTAELPRLAEGYAEVNNNLSQLQCEALYREVCARIHARLEITRYTSVREFNEDRQEAFRAYVARARGPAKAQFYNKFIMAKELGALQERLQVPFEERRQQHRELDQELELIQNYVELHDTSASAEALQRQKDDIDRIQRQLEESYRKEQQQAQAELAAREAEFAQLMHKMREESREKLVEERESFQQNVRQRDMALRQQQEADMARLAQQRAQQESALRSAEQRRAVSRAKAQKYAAFAKKVGMMMFESLVKNSVGWAWNQVIGND